MILRLAEAVGRPLHTREEKDIGWTQMWSSHTGTPGIQYYYPLLLDAAVRGADPGAGRRPRRAPAGRRLGLAGVKGAIRVGADADLMIADLDAPWTITNEGVRSRCGWTPYDGRELRARVDVTYVRGTEVYRGGEVTGKPGPRAARGSAIQLEEDSMAMKFGVLLPHFGEEADRDKLLEGSKKAEQLGFDSVWVRDHLTFEPHAEMEKPNLAWRP